MDRVHVEHGPSLEESGVPEGYGKIFESVCKLAQEIGVHAPRLKVHDEDAQVRCVAVLTGLQRELAVLHRESVTVLGLMTQEKNRSAALLPEITRRRERYLWALESLQPKLARGKSDDFTGLQRAIEEFTEIQPDISAVENIERRCKEIAETHGPIKRRADALIAAAFRRCGEIVAACADAQKSRRPPVPPFRRKPSKKYVFEWPHSANAGPKVQTAPEMPAPPAVPFDPYPHLSVHQQPAAESMPAATVQELDPASADAVPQAGMRQYIFAILEQGESPSLPVKTHTAHAPADISSPRYFTLTSDDPVQFTGTDGQHIIDNLNGAAPLADADVPMQ